MIKLEWSCGFENALKRWLKKHPKDRDLIKNKLEIFTNNTFHPELKNHKLSGCLNDLRAISVTYNCRIIFAMPEKNTALLSPVTKFV